MDIRINIWHARLGPCPQKTNQIWYKGQIKCKRKSTEKSILKKVLLRYNLIIIKLNDFYWPGCLTYHSVVGYKIGLLKHCIIFLLFPLYLFVFYTEAVNKMDKLDFFDVSTNFGASALRQLSDYLRNAFVAAGIN